MKKQSESLCKTCHRTCKQSFGIVEACPRYERVEQMSMKLLFKRYPKGGDTA